MSPPLLTALLAGSREVAIVAATSLVLVGLSGIWRDNLGDAVWIYRILLVSAASVLAGLFARSRTQVHRDRELFSVLSSVAAIADGTRSLQDTVEGLHDIVVPDVADICIVDAVSAGQMQRLAVRAASDADRRARRRL